VNPFFFPIRIYWEDTDAGGIVYYANYLRFMERARTEWLRSLGVEQVRLLREQGLMFVVVNAESQFQRPARYGDLLEVGCEVDKWTKASLTFRQDVYRANAGEERELLVTARVRVACVDAGKFRPKALPDDLLEIMNKEPNVAGEG
jgi:acyl-CoA thioester hydrolase